MADDSWLLESSLERYIPESSARTAAEGTLLREFQRRAHDYIESGKEPTTNRECFALMQHFGAPTRLVDFTRSPYVAALFAFEPTGPQDRAIWAIDRARCYSNAGDFISRSDPAFDGDKGGWFTGVRATWDLDVGPSRWPGPIVLPYEPDRLSGRLAVQQGLFVWPNDIERSFMENLSGLDPDGVQKTVLAGAMRDAALEDLRYMNISRASLFPGLDGFATSLRTLLVSEPERQKDLRRALLGLRLAGDIDSQPRVVSLLDDANRDRR